MLINNISISVVVTVKNDEAGVKRLLEDLDKQTVKPDEIIIVRSEDYGNCTRGRGRNIGIRMARNEFIAVTDAGCRPRRDWVERITAGLYKGLAFEYKGQALFVVAGWYRAVAETPWQKVFLPYLVPTIKKDKKEKRGKGKTFLPASRSIAFTKKAWELAGGYPEEPVSGGEDLKFADKLCNHPGINIIYSPKAVVDWPVPSTLTEFIKDMVKHTRGNFEAGYWPHIVRNLNVVARWMIMVIWPWLIPVYLIWGITRLHQKTAKRWRIRDIAIRVVADAAVFYGTIIGIIDGGVIRK